MYRTRKFTFSMRTGWYSGSLIHTTNGPPLSFHIDELVGCFFLFIRESISNVVVRYSTAMSSERFQVHDRRDVREVVDMAKRLELKNWKEVLRLEVVEDVSRVGLGKQVRKIWNRQSGWNRSLSDRVKNDLEFWNKPLWVKIVQQSNDIMNIRLRNF